MRILLLSLALATVAHADNIQLNTGKIVRGRVTELANQQFAVALQSNQTTSIPATQVTGIDFLGGSARVSVETRDQKLSGVIWLFTRGAFNFQDENGETTRIPLSKIAKIVFGDPPPPAPEPPPPATPTPSASPAASSEKIKLIARGDRVDIAKHCVPGKVTVVDFYADWCGPCRQIAPILERYIANDPDLVLRKIDIVQWNTPVTQQYEIRSVPTIQVYDRRGRLVGQFGGFNETQFQQLIAKAKR